MKRISRRRLCLWLLICSFLCSYITMQQSSNIEKQNGTMDLVSTISMEGQEKLLIVANCNRIEDELKFAKEVLEKYVSNSFHTIKLSSDLSNEIKYLEVTVYLWEEQIGENSPEMKIEYKAKTTEDEYNIRDNPEQFNIYVNNMKRHYAVR